MTEPMIATKVTLHTITSLPRQPRNLVKRWITLAGLSLCALLLAACNGIGGVTGSSGGGGGDGGGSGSAAQVPPTSTPIPTAPAVARPTFLVQRGTVQEVLAFSGRWQPRDQLTLSFEINGTVRRVAVKRGDTVKAEQLLADFQITDLENQLASAQLDLETAQANLLVGNSNSTGSVADAEIALANARLQLQDAINSSPWASVASAYNSVLDARRSVDNAQRNYDTARSDASNTPSQIEQAYNSLLQAQNQLKNAEYTYYTQAQNFNNQKFTVQQRENAVLQAQKKLEDARAGGGIDPQRIQALRSAELRIDQIKGNINRSSLYAPIDAQVLEVNIKPGDQATAFQTVITVGKPDPKEAIANLAIGDAQKLAVGVVGTCQIANKPETLVQCIVRRIPASARDADQTTRVAAVFDEASLGQLIQVEMPLNVRENVLWLPPAAVRTFQNRTFVVVQTTDGPRSIDVVIGLRTDDRVEIKQGLTEGQIVVGP